MTTVPQARPPGSSGGALYGLVALLLIAGGEYYLLTHPATLGAAAETVQAAKAAPAAGGGLLNKFSGGGWEQKLLAGGNKLLALGIGKGLRALLLVISLAMFFVIKAPVKRPGQPRRIPRDLKTVRPALVVMGVLVLLLGVGLLFIDQATDKLLEYGYPSLLAGMLVTGFLGGVTLASTKIAKGELQAEKEPIVTEFGIVLRAAGGQYVNMPNIFRGILVLGGAGAGKTYSIGEPALEQMIGKGMCGLVYDFKFPTLTNAVNKALHYSKAEVKPNSYVVNFRDMELTDKVNPIRPANLTEQALAMEIATTLMKNLSPGGAKESDFFSQSAEMILGALMWFFKNNYPSLCTLPHVVAAAQHPNLPAVLGMLSTDTESRTMVQSIISSVLGGAEKQTAGIVGQLQLSLAKIATKEISWVLAPDEQSGEGFSLDLNNPAAPAILCLGNDASLADTFGPLLSCIISMCIKQMNQEKKKPSFVVIDEGATIYVPGLEQLPATARSRKVCLLYMTQDYAQMVARYGQDLTEVIISNLNNQLIGKVNNEKTAEMVSRMIGKVETEVVSVSMGKSSGGGKAGGGSNQGTSVSIQERQVVQGRDVYELVQGEFIGQTVESKQTFFRGRILREELPGEFPIPKRADFQWGDVPNELELEEKVRETQQRVLAVRAEKELLAGVEPSQPAAEEKPFDRLARKVSTGARSPLELLLIENHTRIYQEIDVVVDRYAFELDKLKLPKPLV
ncbi:type IV secretory system conjugative DNA transfer family protein [Hymenobacter endophyticus]|uniref:TraM recognition domain-containing protein n=1 Tax=Hymenobacter endophyticus TaxID=3076335 RepID=A0ABU3TKV1_9BACT|nr:TraM recognition domain-containing protein [Hymenobacter endophyticus]MDU0372001.1 TraM recognition domain-containing protein [Hymenobacter endophyticus]